MKKEQNLDFLQTLREKAVAGISIIDEALEASKGDEIIVSDAVVEKEDVKILREKLEKVVVAKSLEDIKGLLEEETIPLEMVIMDQFWEELQKDIYDLHDEKTCEYER